jgi:hypothetical protein
MNFSSLPDSNPVAPVDMNAVNVQLRRILSSAAFARSPRSRQLLDYLVGYSLRNPHHPIKEMTIGIELFRRDSASYRPDEDPIVRVQAGRLRQRLDLYYSGVGRNDPLRLTLPSGSYLPAIARGPAGDNTGVRVVLMPLSASTAGRAAHFAAGLDDELRHGLHCDLGHLLVSGNRGRDSTDTHYVVQGSVRADEHAMRAQLALVYGPGGTVVWSVQVDVDDDVTIARQQQIAQLCRAALQSQLQRTH